MDEGVVKAWLKAAWSQWKIEESLPEEVQVIVEDATVELFRRGGDRVMNEFRELKDFIVVELEKDVRVMVGNGANDMKDRLAMERERLEELYRRSQEVPQ